MQRNIYHGKIIDAHGHIYPDKIAKKATESIGTFYDIPMVHLGTAAEMKAGMDRLGVKKQLVCSTATAPEQVEHINDFIAKCCADEPAFFGFGTLHPGYDDYDKELERIRSLGLHGIKLHTDFQGFDIDDERAIGMYSRIEAAGLPILFHMGDKTRGHSEPAQLRRVKELLPDLVAIAAHFGGYSEWRQSEEMLAGLGLLFDTSSTLAILPAGDAVRMIERFGEDNFFYGTDFPMWDHTEEFNRFMKLDLSDEQREKILFRNFERVFGPQ